MNTKSKRHWETRNLNKGYYVNAHNHYTLFIYSLHFSLIYSILSLQPNVEPIHYVNFCVTHEINIYTYCIYYKSYVLYLVFLKKRGLINQEYYSQSCSSRVRETSMSSHLFIWVVGEEVILTMLQLYLCFLNVHNANPTGILSRSLCAFL